MATFSYTAKRLIVRLPFSAEGDDIAVSAGDDTFDSDETDLSGLQAGDFILVSGASNDANNGWHEVAAESTATSIEVLSDLVTESAGSPVSIVGYAHGLGESYTLEGHLAAHDSERRVTKTTQRADSGDEETWYVRADSLHMIRTDWIGPEERRYWEEFLASVEAGEPFAFDPEGTIEEPVAPRLVVLVGDGSRPQRVGQSRRVLYELTLREL